MRNARKCIFFTPISPFLAQKIFFSKIRLHQSLEAVKSYLDTKNQKILMSRSSAIFRTNWLTDRRTDEGKSIGPYLIGRSKKYVLDHVLYHFWQNKKLLTQIGPNRNQPSNPNFKLEPTPLTRVVSLRQTTVSLILTIFMRIWGLWKSWERPHWRLNRVW